VRFDEFMPDTLPTALRNQLLELREVDPAELMAKSASVIERWDHLTIRSLRIDGHEQSFNDPLTALDAYLTSIVAQPEAPTLYPLIINVEVDASALPASRPGRIDWGKLVMARIRRVMAKEFGVNEDACMFATTEFLHPEPFDWVGPENVDDEWPIHVEHFDPHEDTWVPIWVGMMTPLPFISSRIGRRVFAELERELNERIWGIEVSDGGIGSSRHTIYRDGEPFEGAFANFVNGGVCLDDEVFWGVAGLYGEQHPLADEAFASLRQRQLGQQNRPAK